MLANLRRIRRRFLHPDKPDVVFPDRLTVLLTNPRSGSTWLFDAIRCHPAVEVQPSAAVFTWLGMSGRRYPRDLAGDSSADHAPRIEVRPGEWETLPVFDLPESVKQSAVPLPVYALEKCHPHFFKHDVPGFVSKLHYLEQQAKTQVRMIYQVRDPDESLISFLRYKARNPSWNPHIGQDELPAHMQRIYASLLACARAYPGLIVDYAALERDFAAELTRIFRYLWGDGADNPALIDEIQTVTGREQRTTKTATTFLGQSVTRPDRDKSAYTAMFEQHAADIEACHTAYQSLLNLETR